MTTPIVLGSHPEAIIRVRSIANGSVLEVRVSTAASMIVVGEAEPVGELDGAVQEALDRAIAAQQAVHAIARRGG